MSDFKEKPPVGTQVDHSLALEYNLEYDDDKKNYQIALLIAIVLHVFIIWAKIPEGSGPVLDDGGKEKKIIRRVILTPPPEQKLDEIKMKQQVKKVPIPDPTPDEPEPIVEIEDVNEDMIDDNMDDYIAGMPSAPPMPTGPLRSGIAGLENPVYSREQLMSNVIYPELGKKARMQGFVILEVIMQKDGEIGNVKVIGGNLKALGFPEAAIRGARKLSFTPGKLRGIPVDVIMTLTVNFQLKS